MSEDIDKEIQKARFFRAFFCLAALFVFGACVSLESRLNKADQIIQESGLQRQILKTSFFPIFMAHSDDFKGINHATIVIEGDGYSWVNRYRLSNNPTPKNPVGLKIMASLDRPAMYLARPCQYVMNPRCTPAFWSYDRFGEDVISSYMEAFDRIALEYNIEKFNLIGFSGGAYIAFVLSSKRRDIENVVTIAGVLDPRAWTELHDVSEIRIHHRLDDLLTSSDQTKFRHICSHGDDIVPCHHTLQFVQRSYDLNLKNHKVFEYSQENHEDLWNVPSAF